MGLAEDKVKLVLGRDMNPTGEAFCEFSGDGANIKVCLIHGMVFISTSTNKCRILNFKKKSGSVAKRQGTSWDVCG